jgi:hypothetical protein
VLQPARWKSRKTVTRDDYHDAVLPIVVNNVSASAAAIGGDDRDALGGAAAHLDRGRSVLAGSSSILTNAPAVAFAHRLALAELSRRGPNPSTMLPRRSESWRSSRSIRPFVEPANAAAAF